jgi:hypothetical protein
LSFRSSIFLHLAAAAFCAAAPEWKQDLSPNVAGAHPALEPVALDYQVSWKGMIDSGVLHMEFAPPDQKKPGSYVVRAYAMSQGAAARLHPYQFDSWSELNPTSLQPRYVRASETDRNGNEISVVRYFGNRVEAQSTSNPIASSKTEVKDRTFEFSPVFDIFSAMLRIRSLPLLEGDKVNLVIQPSDQPYLLQIRCLGRESHNGQNAIKLSAGMRKIDRDTWELRPYKKLERDATLWLSDDYDRVPLEVRADIFLGDVRATLIQRKKL